MLGLMLSLPQSTKAQDRVNVRKTEIVRLTAKNNDITLRLKVTGDENRPIMNLEKQDFHLKVVDTKKGNIVSPSDNNYSNIPFNWKSPEETVPPPAYIVVLLDFSGSMNCSNDLKSEEDCKKVPKGQRKIDAAISALQAFIESAKKRGGNTNITIVPFGFVTPEYNKRDPKCLKSLPPFQATLHNFLNVNKDDAIQGFFKDLATRIPCTETNIYDSLNESLTFLTDSSNKTFYPVDDRGKAIEPKPRLSVILLTDGYDTQYKTQGEQDQQFKKLKELLQKNPEIIIHTLGYGLTPQQLGEKYQLGHPATRRDITTENPPEKHKVPEEEYVDQEIMKKIATMTGGLSEFSADPKEVTARLQLFLNALLGEYEINYTHPNPERARIYQISTNVAGVNSDAQEYRNLGQNTPVNIYCGMWGLLILFSGLWFIPYEIWRKKLEEEK